MSILKTSQVPLIPLMLAIAVIVLFPVMGEAKPIPGKTYNNPRIGGKAVDHCLHWARQCGWPAAHAMCRLAGHPKALYWARKNMAPTYVIGDRKVCTGGCKGFTKVICQTKAGHNQGGNQGPRSGKIIARIEQQHKCKYRSGPNPGRTSNYLCPVTYSLLNTTGKDIAMSSGWAQSPKAYGSGIDRERIGYRHDLRPGKKMVLGNACVIPHGRSIGTVTLWGSGRHRGDADKHRFKWRIDVKCP